MNLKRFFPAMVLGLSILLIGWGTGLSLKAASRPAQAFGAADGKNQDAKRRVLTVRTIEKKQMFWSSGGLSWSLVLDTEKTRAGSDRFSFLFSPALWSTFAPHDHRDTGQARLILLGPAQDSPLLGAAGPAHDLLIINHVTIIRVLTTFPGLGREEESVLIRTNRKTYHLGTRETRGPVSSLAPGWCI